MSSVIEAVATQREESNGGSTSSSANPPTTARTDLQYNHKKPKWWKILSGKPTKAQKRAMASILVDHRLPVVRYGHFIDWLDIFPKDNDIWLEIGFGQGENLLALAHRQRCEKVSFVGAEIHKRGIGTACRRMQEGIETQNFWTDYETFSRDVGQQERCPDNNGNRINDGESANSDEAESNCPYKNLRLHPGDGVKLLPYIPSLSLATVLVTFPDPFPKKKEAQWRVIQTHTVLQVHRILKEAGCFFLATDHDDFNNWSHAVVQAVNAEKVRFRAVEPCPNRLIWLPAVSKYEQKGWDEGRKTNLSCWIKVETDGI